MITGISTLQDRQSDTFPREDESRELSDALQRIVENTGALLEVSNCSVTLSNAKGVTVVTQTTQPGQGRSYRSTRFRLNEGIASWVAEHREPLVINNVRLDPRFKRQGRTAVGSMMCAPLIDQGNFMGILTASSPQTDAFSLRQLRVLTIFAEQAVLAMTNARQAQQLRDASQVKAKFLSMVTHELRAPLNTINGYLDLALTGAAGELNEQQREFMQRARAGSEHLYALIEDLLLISRADAGQLHLNREEISLQEIMTNAVEELEITAVDNDITITVDVAEDVPPVWADSVRMQQVLRNLISNALRFTPADGSIRVAARSMGGDRPGPDAEDGWVEIEVQDTGCGIAVEYQQRIFERFYQVPRSSGGRTSGQGLGLAAVKTIVELHGGRVTVESVPGQGSVFSFTLPCLTGSQFALD
jgi:signal transduction histidine kinase